jgi:hypothetical protein
MAAMLLFQQIMALQGKRAWAGVPPNPVMCPSPVLSTYSDGTKHNTQRNIIEYHIMVEGEGCNVRVYTHDIYIYTLKCT